MRRYVYALAVAALLALPSRALAVEPVTLLSPAPGATTKTSRPGFTWSLNRDAGCENWWIDDGDEINTDMGPWDTSWRAPGNLFAGPKVWGVKVACADGTQASASRRYKVRGYITSPVIEAPLELGNTFWLTAKAYSTNARSLTVSMSIRTLRGRKLCGRSKNETTNTIESSGRFDYVACKVPARFEGRLVRLHWSIDGEHVPARVGSRRFRA